MVPEYSPQRGNPWKGGFRPMGFLYSFLMVYCNTHSHFSRKNVTPTHTEFVHKVTFFYVGGNIFLKVLPQRNRKGIVYIVPRSWLYMDKEGSYTLARHVREGVRCKFGGFCLDTAAIIMVWYAIQKKQKNSVLRMVCRSIGQTKYS